MTMRFDSPASLEDHILNLLKTGPKSTLFVVEKIKSLFKTRKPTKQGIYKALRKLKTEQVITISGGSVTLHNHFLESLSDYLRIAQKSTRESFLDDAVLQLTEGERITYSFSTVEKTDIFWAHLFSLLIDTLNPQTPLYTYEPHNWFILSSRRSSELKLIRKMHRGAIPFLITVGHATPLDIVARKEYAITPNIQYHNEHKASLGGINYHLNIFGDVILEIWTDKKSAQKIHDFFLEHKRLDDSLQKVLESFIHMSGKSRIVVSRDKKRADIIKKKLNKFFWVK